MVFPADTSQYCGYASLSLLLVGLTAPSLPSNSDKLNKSSTSAWRRIEFLAIFSKKEMRMILWKQRVFHQGFRKTPDHGRGSSQLVRCVGHEILPHELRPFDLRNVAEKQKKDIFVSGADGRKHSCRNFENFQRTFCLIHKFRFLRFFRFPIGLRPPTLQTIRRMPRGVFPPLNCQGQNDDLPLRWRR